jgi:hypothetical protein
MPDYSKGQIYTIRFYDNENLIYIGSTIQPLAVRFGGHKVDKYCSLVQYIQEHYNGDFKCCYIELLEYFKCDNKQELNKREGEIIRKFKEDDKYNVINKKISGRTQKEYYQDNKDNIKQYYNDNADKIKEQIKKYKQDNRDKILEKKKQYYQDNKEKYKQYRKDNADKIKEYNNIYIQENKEYYNQYYQRKKAAAKAATETTETI